MKKSADPNYLIIGKIGAPFGVKGWLKILSYTEFDASILDYQPWYITTEHAAVDIETAQPIEIEDSRAQAKGVVVKFKGMNNPETARSLTGKYIAMAHHQLPILKDQEYYWSDLEGLTVINQQGEILGKVTYIMETGSNDVLVVKGSKELAIPYLPGKVVTSIDLTKREIHVNWEII